MSDRRCEVDRLRADPATGAIDDRTGPVGPPAARLHEAQGVPGGLLGALIGIGAHPDRNGPLGGHQGRCGRAHDLDGLRRTVNSGGAVKTEIRSRKFLRP